MNALGKLFGRSKLNEYWRNSKWGGVRFWSESVKDKKAPETFAKNIFKNSSLVDIPLFIRLYKLRPVGEDPKTGQIKIWTSTLEVFWPAGTGRDKEVVSLINDAHHVFGGFGTAHIDYPPIRSNFDELESEKKVIETWKCNFDCLYIRDPRAVDALLKALNDPETGLTAVKRLGWTADARAVDPLIGLLQSEEYDLREKYDFSYISVESLRVDIAKSLIRLGDTRGTELSLKVLEEYFYSEIGYERTKIADILVQVGSPAMKIFIDALNSKEGQILLLSTSALKDIGDVRAVEPLVALFRRKVSSLRDNISYSLVLNETAEALEQINASEAVEPLVELVCDQSIKENVREIVAGVLGNIGDKRAVEPLKLMINNKDTKPRIKKLLGEVIKKIEAREP